ncbi:MIP/aquaporin family protein [Mucisphaera calidilacus]|uniref:Glycerol uptake facilitator protein n=1 Tax=Mucisphaera calidilacus TaxID=2527982 RepID=A0A518BYS9_9BACT|nr:MIP/aquaporin family protein [Mucisphaera calidilacus]QDU72120.1 Glycerol uptake facilitator protein [Mucisphaera calidilacus]
MADGQPDYRAALLGEVLGTFVLVLFGLGAVHAAVLTGAMSGLWQVAAVWGLAVTFGIYVSAAVSGAHLNPAVTVAFAVWRGFSWAKVPGYVAAQLAGAALAAWLLNVMYGGMIEAFHASAGIDPSSAGGAATASMYGMYFPNPEGSAGWVDRWGLVSVWGALLAELVGTALLVGMVFCLTDTRERHAACVPAASGVPWAVGFTVAAIVCLVAPLTQAGLNPARDLGPRAVAFVAGWGETAFPGPRGGFWVYTVGPLLGGLVGAWVWERVSAWQGSAKVCE